MSLRTPRVAASTAVILLLLLAGCGTFRGTSTSPGSTASVSPGPATSQPSGSADTGGTQVRSISVGGVPRSYRLHVPSRLDADPALVIMLHGAMGSAQTAELAYGWDAQADTSGFIVAYPDGQDRVWNAGDCCGAASRTAVDDVGFISAVVGQLQSEFGVPPPRTFAAGMSNGAMMAYRLACDTSLFAAIAPVSGTIVTSCAHPTPTSVIHIHGTDDPTVQMDGVVGSGPGQVQGLPVVDAVGVFRAADECGPSVTTTQGVVTTDTANCAQGREVTLMTIQGGTHHWPGDRSPASLGTGGASGASGAPETLDATATIWDFFNAH
jgi:polyhydroxybutyrate depolymerase